MTDKELIKQEIERRILQCYKCLSQDLLEREISETKICLQQYKELLQFIDSFPEEHIKFPNERSIVDKIFGAGNLESWEYEEAKKLVLLAKEELLKDLESGCEADCTTKDDDLEAEIQRYFSEEKWILKPVEEIAIHFANWQHGKDFDDLLQSEMKFPKEYYEKGKADAMNEMKETLQTEYEKGRYDMREEMMKTLVEGEIVKDIHNQLSVKSEQINDTFGKFGDKVKIIIIKQD